MAELKDSVYLIGLQGINQLLPLFVMPYLMLVLGASGYGYVGFAFSMVQYVDIIVSFGFNLSATKNIALVKEHVEERSKVFWNVLAAKLLLLLLTTIVLIFVVKFIEPFQPYQLVVYATLPMVLGSTFTFMWFYQGIGLVRIFSIINTLSKIILLPMIFFLIKSSSDFVLAAFLQALVFVFTALLSNIYLFQKKLVRFVKPSLMGIKHELSESFPLFLSTASTSVYTQLFVVLLGFYCTSEMIGRYSSAERIMRAICFVLYVPLNQAFFPRISAFSVANPALAIQSFKVVRLLVALIMFSVGLLLFWAAPCLPEFMGTDYLGIESLLRIMAFAPFAIGLGGVYGQMGLVAMGDKKDRIHFQNAYFQVALLALLSAAVLIPTYKEYGAAVALLLSEWSVFILMVYYFRRK